MRSGFRLVTNADLVEDSTELTAVLRRASQLAIEHGELHRVVLDLEKQVYWSRSARARSRSRATSCSSRRRRGQERALERGQEQLRALPSGCAGGRRSRRRRPSAPSRSPATTSPTGRAAGDDSVTGDAKGRAGSRKLRKDKGIKFKEVWVEHRDDSASKGQVAIYFFPLGSSEKSVIELTDGSEVFTVLVYGLTGRVELQAMASLERRQRAHAENVMGDRDPSGRTSNEGSRMGFTLLEVMFGLALLGFALTVLIKSAADNIFSAEQAHMMGVATDLARGKMYDIEETAAQGRLHRHRAVARTTEAVLRRGLADDLVLVQDRAGRAADFDKLQAMAQAARARAFAARAGTTARRSAARRLGVRGSDALGGFQNSALGGMLSQFGGGGAGGGGGGAGAMAGASFIQGQYSMFQEILKVSIRKVTLTVNWQVMGNDRDMQVVAFFTDAAAMDKVLNGIGSQELPDNGRLGLGLGSGSGSSGQPTRGRSDRGAPGPSDARVASKPA